MIRESDEATSSSSSSRVPGAGNFITLPVPCPLLICHSVHSNNNSTERTYPPSSYNDRGRAMETRRAQRKATIPKLGIKQWKSFRFVRRKASRFYARPLLLCYTTVYVYSSNNGPGGGGGSGGSERIKLGAQLWSENVLAGNKKWHGDRVIEIIRQRMVANLRRRWVRVRFYSTQCGWTRWWGSRWGVVDWHCFSSW